MKLYRLKHNILTSVAGVLIIFSTLSAVLIYLFVRYEMHYVLYSYIISMPFLLLATVYLFKFVLPGYLRTRNNAYSAFRSSEDKFSMSVMADCWMRQAEVTQEVDQVRESVMASICEEVKVGPYDGREREFTLSWVGRSLPNCMVVNRISGGGQGLVFIVGRGLVSCAEMFVYVGWFVFAILLSVSVLIFFLSLAAFSIHGVIYDMMTSSVGG